MQNLRIWVIFLCIIIAKGLHGSEDHYETREFPCPIPVNIEAKLCIFDLYHFGPLNRYRSAIMDAALRYDLDPYLIAGIIWQESKGRRYVTGGVGEAGLMQIRPEYHLLGVHRRLWYSPWTNIMRGSRYLKHCIVLKRSLRRGISCYNTGENNPWINAAYVNNVLGYRNTFSKHFKL